MNAVEIEEAVSALAEAPFDADDFPFSFLAAFGNKDATGKSYQGYRERVGQLLSHLSSADQDKILGHNALKLYRFGS